MEKNDNVRKISVIGLGQMGKKIAELYASAKFDVMVWNRTAGRAAGLANVKVAGSVDEAIAHGSLQIICVYDNKGTQEVLNRITDKRILTSKTIVNFTTGSPGEAEALEAWVREAGGYYLNGAIQVAPDQMGMSETTILMGGNSTAYKRVLEDLRLLGGNLRYLGEKAAASSAMDLATLTWLYGSYIGLIYGIRLTQAFGLKLDDFGKIIAEIVPGFTDFFRHEVSMVSAGNYDVTQSPLEISVLATKRIADTFRTLPVAQEFPQVMASILAKAGAQYNGTGKEVSIVLKVIDEAKVSSPVL